MTHPGRHKSDLERLDIADLLGAPDPYPLFQKLRDTAPLAMTRFYGRQGVCLVTQYDDVRRAFGHSGLSSDWRQGGEFEEVLAVPDDVRQYFDGEIVGKDGEDHARLRALAGRAFTARRVATLRERIEMVVSDLLDQLAKRHIWDVVADFASVIPIVVLSDLLGVAPSYRAELASHVSDLLDVRPGAREQVVPRAARGLVELIKNLIAQSRANPGDDLLSALVLSRDTDGAVTDQELVSLVMLIIRAGYETTGNAIATGVLLLLTELDVANRHAVVTPARIKETFEEVLRFSGPADMVVRYSKDEVDLISGSIPPGHPVVLCCSAANRDPRRFDRPEEFDPLRTDVGHVGFGYGPHFCLGAALARVEGEVALSALLCRWPDLALAIDRADVTWRPSLMRGVERLPVGRVQEAQ